jgi:hypothetical protein
MYKDKNHRFFVFITESRCVDQGGLELLILNDPPASASQGWGL